MAASCTLRMKRLVKTWSAAAVILLISVGGTASSTETGRECRSTETNPVPPILWPEFRNNGHMSREIRNELIRQSPWPLDIQEH